MRCNISNGDGLNVGISHRNSKCAARSDRRVAARSRCSNGPTEWRDPFVARRASATHEVPQLMRFTSALIPVPTKVSSSPPPLSPDGRRRLNVFAALCRIMPLLALCTHLLPWSAVSFVAFRSRVAMLVVQTSVAMLFLQASRSHQHHSLRQAVLNTPEMMHVF